MMHIQPTTPKRPTSLGQWCAMSMAKAETFVDNYKLGRWRG